MNRKDFFVYVDDWFSLRCKGLSLSESKKWLFWWEFSKGGDLDEILLRTWDNLKVLTNYPIFWKERGATDEEAIRYSKENKDWKICNQCGKIFNKSEGFKTACSKEHYTSYRATGFKKLSESRKKYNNRDPVQYANRHGISVPEATQIINKFVLEGCARNIAYWMKNGFSEEESKNIISERQSKISPRSLLYWINKGLSEEEAKTSRTKHQSECGKKSKQKYGCVRVFSPRCTEYFMARGYSKEEATEIISETQSEISNHYVTNTPTEIRRAHNWMCKEYYIQRFPESWQEEYSKSFEIKHSSNFRSKGGDLFCTMLNERFSWLESNRYFGDREFTTYSEELKRVVKYDYVDTKLKVVVEYNGDYWHGNPKKYPGGTIMEYPNGSRIPVEVIWAQDLRKSRVMEERGYRVFSVWEMDCVENINLVLDELYEEILNANS